jgi:acetyl-CoA hydrolase
MGTSRLFRHAHNNPGIALRPTSYTHDPAVLAQLPQLVAINSAIEVDLTGQVNSEVAGGRYVGAVGGALDFLRGAQRSPGGLPIVALPSTARGASRIVAQLSGPATIGRGEAPIIVTEHGIADLRGLTLPARRERLLAITDPAHAGQLDAIARGPGESTRPAPLETHQ